MPPRCRVSALAKELGISSKDVLAKLAEMGEFVKSASSVVEPPVADQIRAAFLDRPSAPPASKPKKVAPSAVAPTTPGIDRFSNRIRDPFDPLYIPVVKARRGPYLGDEPAGLKRLILDEYVVRRSDARRPRGSVRYWASEVAEAESLTAKWAPLLLDGMTPRQVMRWIQVLSAHSSEKAAALFAEGIDPDEVEFDLRFDIGRPSLQTRLCVGNITPAQAVAEIRERRNVS